MCAILIFAKMKKRKETFPSISSDRVRPMFLNIKSELECVLFDWDGTLLDSFEADAQAYIHMFAALGMKWSIAELKRHYSPNWHHVYRAARLPRAKWEDADRLWMKFYRTHQPELQPGARRVLSALERRFILALVSSGSRARVRRQLREHEVAAMFRTKVCSEDAPRRKPHPAPLRLALDRLRLSPEVCVISAMRRRTSRWRIARECAPSVCSADRRCPSGCAPPRLTQRSKPSANCPVCSEISSEGLYVCGLYFCAERIPGNLSVGISHKTSSECPGRFSREQGQQRSGAIQ